jgi:hypothetical protein
MIRLYPDHGGSDYLATQINRARDVLLRPQLRRVQAGTAPRARSGGGPKTPPGELPGWKRSAKLPFRET